MKNLRVNTEENNKAKEENLDELNAPSAAARQPAVSQLSATATATQQELCYSCLV